MWIFIGGLPGSATRAELETFVLQSLSGRFHIPFLSPRPSLQKIDILEVVERDTGRSEFHGLVRVEPDKAGQELIRRLGMRRFKGARLKVHRYLRRSWTRDRRAIHAAAMVDIDSDRRSADRRRHRLLISRRSHPRVESRDQFRRQHGW